MGHPSPNLPEHQSISVAVKRTAVLVLDGSQRWSNPKQPCHRLVPGMTAFLERVREAGMPILYTISARSPSDLSRVWPVPLSSVPPRLPSPASP
jgi:hypothetical protein